MITKEIRIKGKVYEGQFNNSMELNTSIEGLADEVIRDLPAKASASGSCVYRKIDGDQWIKVGSHFMTESEKKANRAAHGGSGSGSGPKSLTEEQVAQLLSFVPEEKQADYKKVLGDMGLLKKTEEQKAVDKVKSLGLSKEELLKMFGY